jgi:hypothetical protein
MATATSPPATGKNSEGPRCRTSTPEIATDSGKLPNAHSMTAPITRPSTPGETHFCTRVRKMTLPRPLAIPQAKSAAAAPASPPR